MSKQEKNLLPFVYSSIQNVERVYNTHNTDEQYEKKIVPLSQHTKLNEFTFFFVLKGIA